jgi:hypothetical protein
MDDSAQSGGTITAPAPGNPALDAARAELTDIATNPANPRHAAYQRGDKQVSEYLDGLYKRAVPDTAAPATPTDPASGRDTEPAPTLTAEDRIAQAEVETMLQRTLGEDYESEMSDMRIGVQHLSSRPDAAKALAIIAPLIGELGDLLQVRGIRFLAEIGQHIKQHGGRS